MPLTNYPVGSLPDPNLRLEEIYTFKEGSIDDKRLLSSKAAHICEITRMGIPTPPGFVLSTEVSKLFQVANDTFESNLHKKIMHSIQELEENAGRTFGSGTKPLVLSLRSGALVTLSEQAHTSIGSPESWKVPGVMNTLLGLGMNDIVVKALSLECGLRAVLNDYAHFLMRYGMSIYEVPSSRYHNIIIKIARCDHMTVRTEDKKHVATECISYPWSVEDLQSMIDEFKQVQPIPEDVWEQLRVALRKIYKEWNSDAAVAYRNNLGMDPGAGVAVIISQQILGGSGVFSSRCPTTGERGLSGFYWPEASGTKLSMEEFCKSYPQNFAELVDFKRLLEMKFQDMQDIEFSMDPRNKLWILNSVAGHRRPRASLKIANRMIQEGLITERMALSKIDPKMISNYVNYCLMIPTNKADAIIGNGIAASDAITCGCLAFSFEDCVRIVSSGRLAILCKTDCAVTDIPAIKLASAVITTKGTATSSTAIFCRALGKICVTGATNLFITHSEDSQCILMHDTMIPIEGVLTVDGSSGNIYKGNVVNSEKYVDEDFDAIMKMSRNHRKLQVFSNAHCLMDCQRAVKSRADGVSLLTTDWMFSGSDLRLRMVQSIIFQGEECTSVEKYAALENLLVEDFKSIYSLSLTTDEQKPVMIQLVGNDVCEFLPQHEENLAKTAADLNLSVQSMKRCMEKINMKTTIGGHLGNRIDFYFPVLVGIQVRALLRAVAFTNEALLSKRTSEGLKSPAMEGETIVPLVALPWHAWGESIGMLMHIVTEVAKTFMVSNYADADKSSPIPTESNQNTKAPTVVVDGPAYHSPSGDALQNIVNIGITINTPAACIGIEDLMKVIGAHSTGLSVSFVTFDLDRITESIFGTSKNSFEGIGRSFPEVLACELPRCPYAPSQVNCHMQKNVFAEIDESTVGVLISQCVSVARRQPTQHHLKIGMMGDVLCSNNKTIRYLNALDIDYIACNPAGIETACLCAAQAQIRYSATGSGLFSDSMESWSNWYSNMAHTPNSTSNHFIQQVSPDAISKNPNTYYNSPAGMMSKFSATSRKLPYINLWDNAETESNSTIVPMVSPFHDPSTPGPPLYDNQSISPSHY